LKPLADVTDHRDDPLTFFRDVLNVEELWGDQEIAACLPLHDRRGRVLVLRRIRNIETGAENTDRVAAYLEGCAMGDAVDAAGQPADDHVASADQPPLLEEWGWVA
jgi:hypothetical protein